MKEGTKLIFLDIETTGLDTSKDRIVELGIVGRLWDGFSWRMDGVSRFLLNPEIPIHPRASKVHGYTDEQVKRFPTFTEMSSRILSAFGDETIVGYNIDGFDIPIVRRQYMEIGIQWPSPSTVSIDLFPIFKNREPGRHDLASAVYFYTGRIPVRRHGAIPDACSAIRVFEAQTLFYPDIRLSDEPLQAMSDIVFL